MLLMVEKNDEATAKLEAAIKGMNPNADVQKVRDVLLKIRKGTTTNIQAAQMVKLGIFALAGLDVKFTKIGSANRSESRGYELLVGEHNGTATIYKPFRCYFDWHSESEAKKAGEVNVYPRYDLFKWLKTEFDFERRVCEALGMEKHVPANRRSKDGTGTCPCCFRNIKIKVDGYGPRPTPGRQTMVAHGYTQEWNRGAHKGDDCIASKRFEPYENSNEGVYYMIGALKGSIGLLEKSIEQLKTRVDTSAGKYYYKGDENDVQVLMSSEAQLAEAKVNLAFFEERAKDWKVRPLPKEGEPLPDYVH